MKNQQHSPVDDLIMIVPTPKDLPDQRTYTVTMPKPRPQGPTNFTFDMSSFDRNFAEIFGGAQ